MYMYKKGPNGITGKVLMEQMFFNESLLVERFLKSTVPINVNVSSYHSFKALNAGYQSY